ncbi:hypothetical protein BC828DRAFT_393584 [Blastocladiella britannica]|nr:hypothetical protein BC828DRAFT_393584 [Blastocladiella britannica]
MWKSDLPIIAFKMAMCFFQPPQNLKRGKPNVATFPLGRQGQEQYTFLSLDPQKEKYKKGPHPHPAHNQSIVVKTNSTLANKFTMLRTTLTALRPKTPTGTTVAALHTSWPAGAVLSPTRHAAQAVAAQQQQQLQAQQQQQSTDPNNVTIAAASASASASAAAAAASAMAASRRGAAAPHFPQVSGPMAGPVHVVTAPHHD